MKPRQQILAVLLVSSPGIIRSEQNRIRATPCKCYTSLNKRGIHIIVFLFPYENICCGYSLEVPRLGEALLMSTHNIHFHGEIRKKYQFFLIEKSSLSGVMALFLFVVLMC